MAASGNHLLSVFIAQYLRRVLILVARQGVETVSASQGNVALNLNIALALTHCAAGSLARVLAAFLRTIALSHAIEGVVKRIRVTLGRAAVAAWKLLAAQQIAARFGRDQSEVFRPAHQQWTVQVAWAG